MITNATLIHTPALATLNAMENSKRTWAKALTWQTTGLIIMTGVNYVVLGSLQQSMGLSTLLSGMGMVTYVVHERLWARVRWGLHKPMAPPSSL